MQLAWARQVGQVATITLALVWLPWVAWLTIDNYVLGHYDPKLGSDGGFVFGVGLTGAAAAVSAVVTGVAHALEMRLGRPLSWHARRGIVVLNGLTLAALSSVVPSPGFWGLQGGGRFVIPWAVVSVACVTTLLGAARWRTAR
ncbi:MAG: hypothetical protein AB7N24_23870 [Dehalococcoidia bacterium]